MKKGIVYKLFFALIALLFVASCEKKETKIATYPAPESEIAKTDYSVSVNGHKLDIYSAQSMRFEGGEYYFTYFDFEGEVEIKVGSEKSLENAELYPARHKADSKSENELIFKADKAFQVAVLRNERNMPLVIFGNPIEKNAPKKGDENVIYLDAGVHEFKEGLHLKNNQTLYLAGGSVLKGFIKGKGDNITVRGRGIISGDIFPYIKDDRNRIKAQLANFENCKNLNFEGIIIKDPIGWTFVLQSCEGVKIDNMKICGSRTLNDDAVDICNTSKVHIKNSFFRAQDDIIAIKGIKGSQPCQNIIVEDSILWTDVANIFRIGYECEAKSMNNIRFRNLDIPFYSINYREPKTYWSNAIIWLQPSNDMPIYDVHFENLNVRSNGSDILMLMAKPFIIRKSKIDTVRDTKTAGSIKNCSIKNLRVVGKKGNFRGKIHIAGHSAQRNIENLSLENITYFGEKINQNSPCVELFEEFTNGITFK